MHAKLQRSSKRIELIIRIYMRPACRRCDMHIFSERCLQTASSPKRRVVLGGACLE